MYRFCSVENERGEEDEVRSVAGELLSSTRAEHDLNWSGMEPGDGPTFFPNHIFFVRPIAGGGGAAATTARELRAEEREAVGGRFSGVPAQEAGTGFGNRDYHALCRGEELVLKDFR